MCLPLAFKENRRKSIAISWQNVNNGAFRVVYSDVRRMLVAVGETAKGAIPFAACMSGLVCAVASAPCDAQVTAGGADAPSIVQTQQAGYVDGNPNLRTDQVAKVIVNQVNSPGASSIRGYAEVAGSKAEAVVANPSGIDVNGSGFINASRAILTTVERVKRTATA